MLEAARGAAYLVTQSRTIYIGGPVEVITETAVLGLSLPFILALAVVVAGQLVLSRTVFGRYLIAIGTNEEAVRLSGIDPRPYKLAVFVLAGLLAAVAAVIQTARMSSANPNTAIGFELQVIAAVVIGGTSLMGGRGSVVSSFFGVLIIAVLGAGLAQVGAQEYTKRLITGCVIVAAVILDQYRHRLDATSRRGRGLSGRSRFLCVASGILWPWRWSRAREIRHRQAPKTPLDAATRPGLTTLPVPGIFPRRA